jgi:hypothetical protein
MLDILDISPRPAPSSTSDAPVVTPDPAPAALAAPQPAAPRSSPPSPEPDADDAEDIAIMDEAGVRAAEQQVAAAHETLQRLGSVGSTARPRRSEFNDPDSYDDALIQWSSVQGARELERQGAERAKAEAEARLASSVRSSWNARRAAAIEVHSDWQDVVERDDLAISPVMGEAILRAANGPAVAYHLGKNPDEAARIARLPPAAQLVAMGKLEARVAAPSRTEGPPQAPRPSPAPRRPAARAEPETMAAYAARRNREMAESRRRF